MHDFGYSTGIPSAFMNITETWGWYALGFIIGVILCYFLFVRKP